MKIDFEKLKKEKKAKDRAMATDRYQNILNFYYQKGLLKLTEKPRLIRNQKIHIKDILWAAKYEPRILEVFPAAFIHFKSKFDGIEKLPKALEDTILHIENKEKSGPDYKGILYKDMKRWANIPLKDTRSKPLSKQKKLTSFKFSKDIIAKLEKASTKNKKTKTQILEELVLSYL